MACERNFALFEEKTATCEKCGKRICGTLVFVIENVRGLVMRIKKVLWLLICMGMLTLGACGKSPQAEDGVTPELTMAAEPTVEPTSAPTPEPTATPVPTEQPKEEITMEDKNVVTEVTCPAEVCTKRAEVTYGTVEHITYQSATTGLERGANVLLPADYSEEKQYAVLYFQHGIFGDENSLIGDNNNKIKEIVGNLVEDGYLRDVIVVFPNMYAKTDPNQQPGFSAEAVLPYDNFINDLVNDLIPVIEGKYSVLTDRENRAILGFSMGGRETLFIGLSRPDLFGYIGAVAPAPGLVPGKDHFMEHVGQMQEEDVKFAEDAILPEVLMVCCGTKDGVVGKFPQSYHELFDKNGVEHIWYEVPNADHDSNAIRSGLYNLLIRWGK